MQWPKVQLKSLPRAAYDIFQGVGPWVLERLMDQVPWLRDFVARIRETETNKHLGGIYTSSLKSASELAELRLLLQNYHRLELFGQIGSIFTMAAAVAQIKRLADETAKMAGFLEGLEQLLRTAHIQGDNFPDHVYDLLRMTMELYSADNVPHYFTVYHRGTQWHPKFASLQRSRSLGPGFLGYKTDLDELCAFLTDEVRPRVGKDAVFHVLIPNVGPLAITEAVALPSSMKPCYFEGELGDTGKPFVWLCVPTQDQNCLRHVGVLEPRKIWAFFSTAGISLPFVHQYLCRSLPTQYFVDPNWSIQTGIDIPFFTGRFVCLGPEPHRTLGQRQERPWA